MKKEVPIEEIESFLEGKDPQKYIISVEGSYSSQFVDMIVNDPKVGKSIQKVKYKPFLWAKPEGMLALYDGKKDVIRKMMDKAGITAKKLKISDDDGNTPERMANGFTLLIQGNCSYGDLINFFKRGGVDIFADPYRENFITLSIVEQFLIQTGKRLFKGMEDYDDLHRFQFDLETTGLNPKVNRIFAIGIKDNRGHEIVLEVDGDTEQELKDKEISAIETFFLVLNELKPDLIAGYNSENFDFEFFKERCHQLGVDLSDIAITLDPEMKLQRKKSTVKYGGDTEYYEQTLMYGYNIIDIYHAVRRAQAINSNIKKADLKYITKFSKINKPNRVYIKGDMIFKTWSDSDHQYALNDTNGDWYRISDKYPLKEGYEITTGRYIVNRYLLDDLWETEHVDFSFNQASFLLAKIVPTTYAKVCTMGTASLWKLLMCAWSYEQGLGVPSYQDKRDFTGGLSRLLECGYAKGVVKFDYAALYPNTELSHDIFPVFDISGVMKGMLLYIAVTRDKYKALKKKHEKRKKEIEEKMAEYEKNGELTPELKKKCLDAIAKHDKLAKDFDKKQLPIKILANSFFGSFGAPYIFPWGDVDCAEETTCRGRQYLRLLVKFFTEKYGFRALVMDTDGVNFAVPENVDSLVYTSTGNHRFTEKGKVYKGIYAPLAEFNDLYMIERMGLDVDEIADATINFARKNYADLIDGEIKLVGNTIKSKKMEIYIEEFLDKGIRLLLEGKGHEFIDFYYEYVDAIYNYQIPLVKIASKGRVKQSVDEYKKKGKKLNKAGNPMPKQAHMELIIQHDLTPDLGDTIYYVNTGTKKSHGDIKTIKNKETGKSEIEMHCMLIPNDQIENDPELTTNQYNVSRYLDKFNKRIKPLLVVFHPEIRDNILIEIKTDKKSKVSALEDRSVFTKKQTELTAGMPYNPEDQDRYEDLMRMEDKEIRFWNSVNKLPNNIEQPEWDAILADYFDRLARAKAKGIQIEKKLLDEKIKRLEIEQLDEFVYLLENDPDKLELWAYENLALNLICDTDEKEFYLASIKWEDEKICPVTDIFKYKEEAEDRAVFYSTLSLDDMENRYEIYTENQEKLAAEALNMTLEQYRESLSESDTDDSLDDLIYDWDQKHGEDIEVEEDE